MVRRYEEAVEVRAVRASGDVTSRPRQFLWRGRLYVVREVLSHWYERAAWWDGAPSRVLHGESDGGSTALSVAGGEREVWRVEASAGRSSGPGVYDLCSSGDAWRLLRVAD